MFNNSNEEQLFWIMTRPFWEGVPLSQREDAVLNAMGASSLEEAMNEVLDRPEAQEALEQAEYSGGHIEDTDNMAAAYQQAKRIKKKIDTPTSFTNPRLTEWTKAYGA